MKPMNCNHCKEIVTWLRRQADNWQVKEGPHDKPVDDCNCCMECGEAITLRIAADEIGLGHHMKPRRKS